MDFLTGLFDTSGFPPRWYCGEAWTKQPSLGWMHIVSDFVTWLSYMAIPIVLACFMLRRRDVVFPRIFWLFSAFIFSCGFVHLAEVITFWVPVYRFSALLKIITAVVSSITVIAVVRVLPTAISLPGLAKVNKELNEEIKQRKLVESALRESNRSLEEAHATLKAVLDSSRNSIGLLNLDGKLVYANKTALNATGATEAETFAVPFWETAWWTHSEKLQNQLKLAISSASQGKQERFEATHVSADGSPLIIDFSLTPVFSDDGKVLCLIPEGRDITEEKQFTQMLEQKVAERTSELQVLSQSLSDNNAELLRSNDELQKFAYVASHDLRAPLRGVSHLANCIEEDLGEANTEGIHYNFTRLRGRLQRMNGLLDGLLGYARAGMATHSETVVDTKKMVEDVIEDLGIGSEFQFTYLNEMPTLTTFPTPLRQVFHNLIDNAVKHHDGERGNITIGCEDTGDHYEFRIGDDGPGIETRFHEKVFELFQTLKSRDELEGSGMGLPIIRKSIEKIGGSITLESDVGQGSTFVMLWPKVITIQNKESDLNNT